MTVKQGAFWQPEKYKLKSNFPFPATTQKNKTAARSGDNLAAKAKVWIIEMPQWATARIYIYIYIRSCASCSRWIFQLWLLSCSCQGFLFVCFFCPDCLVFFWPRRRVRRCSRNFDAVIPSYAHIKITRHLHPFCQSAGFDSSCTNQEAPVLGLSELMFDF